ncbi:APC family permease [Pseudonocardia sp. KRD291]|uniref:APC family permease n=1 Tax=Pseudonocardia sp. KRD291 TaxID=2792007 RepID=UPI001C4A142B|nr:APC family permease [Pseudonocardia sp. KRD291]MBW0103979.1 APC family permease [Pseudonocardia sp. KRD291]
MPSTPSEVGPTVPAEAVSTNGTEFRRSLGTGRVALLVIAAASPLGAVLGNIPLGVTLGNGAGLPSVFLVAGLVLICFAVGYVAINRALPGGGGFARYVRAGCGEAAGLAAAYATMLAYTAGTIAITATFGYFADLLAGSYGLDLPWWIYAIGAAVAVGLLGRRAADLGARLLLVLILAEFVILIVLDVAILLRHGLDALPTATFDPSVVFSGAPGPALMIAFTSFIGIESAVLYANEARNPATTVPRAIYLSVGSIAVFYFLSAWLIVGAVGVDRIVGLATETEGDLVTVVAGDNAGNGLVMIMQVFFCTSILACLVALHNAAVRYAQTLGTQGTMPRALGVLNRRSRGPAHASDTLFVLTVLLNLAFAYLGLDPYTGVYASLGGVFTVGIVGMQAVVAAVAIRYFRRHRDPRIWTTVVAPTIAAVGLFVAVAFIVANYPALTGTTAVLPNLLPALYLVAIAAAVVVHRVQQRRPPDHPAAAAPVREGY